MAKSKQQFIIVLFWLGLVMVTPSLAWNRAGHMVTGAIAYRELKATNPAALAKIIALLKQHPDYPNWQSQSNNQGLTGENAELYVFAMAAGWADDARQTAFDHPSWHYVNLPVIPPGQSITPPQPAMENILKAYAANLSILTSNAPTADRVIALCWLFHLIGDVHQPLHTTALFSSEYPKGDRGGNSIYIRVKPESATINLHGFWDDFVMGSDRLQSVTNKASELRTMYNRHRFVELTEKRFDEWAQESFNLAVQHVYRIGAGGPIGGPDKENGVALPSDYIPQGKPIAERRVALAGYRLADVLASTITAKPSAPMPTSPTGARIIGNRNSKVYHLSNCPGYNSMSEKNRVMFRTEAEAQGAGYRKAGNCP